MVVIWVPIVAGSIGAKAAGQCVGVTVKISSYLSLPLCLGAGYWVLDHLAPDLLPKLPHNVALPIAVGAVVLMVIALSILGWRRLVEALPLPWFPHPFWRVGYWLYHRPSVAIQVVGPKANSSPVVMLESTIGLTIWRNLSRLREPAAIRFDKAMLHVVQTRDGKERRYAYRPVEAGGLLAQPVTARPGDAIILDFSATCLPLALADAPDFNQEYELRLTGVVAEVQGAKPFAGELPEARFAMAPLRPHDSFSGLAVA